LCSGIVIIIAKINVSIALLAILAAALPILFTRIYGKYNEKYSRENREVNGILTDRIYEIFKGFREIKINNSGKWASTQITTWLNKLIKLGNNLRRVDFTVNKGVYLLNLLTSIGIYLLSVYLISKKLLTIGNFLAIVSYIAILHKNLIGCFVFTSIGKAEKLVLKEYPEYCHIKTKVIL
jgi:ABC-type bacteriocin/lantibiotic exporter with double-glycine peptidase domain